MLTCLLLGGSSDALYQCRKSKGFKANKIYSTLYCATPWGAVKVPLWNLMWGTAKEGFHPFWKCKLSLLKTTFNKKKLTHSGCLSLIMTGISTTCYNSLVFSNCCYSRLKYPR